VVKKGTPGYRSGKPYTSSNEQAAILPGLALRDALDMSSPVQAKKSVDTGLQQHIGDTNDHDLSLDLDGLQEAFELQCAEELMDTSNVSPMSSSSSGSSKGHTRGASTTAEVTPASSSPRSWCSSVQHHSDLEFEDVRGLGDNNSPMSSSSSSSGLSQLNNARMLETQLTDDASDSGITEAHHDVQASPNTMEFLSQASMALNAHRDMHQHSGSIPAHPNFDEHSSNSPHFKPRHMPRSMSGSSSVPQSPVRGQRQHFGRTAAPVPASHHRHSSSDLVQYTASPYRVDALASPLRSRMAYPRQRAPIPCGLPSAGVSTAIAHAHAHMTMTQPAPVHAPVRPSMSMSAPRLTSTQSVGSSTSELNPQVKPFEPNASFPPSHPVTSQPHMHAHNSGATFTRAPQASFGPQPAIFPAPHVPANAQPHCSVASYHQPQQQIQQPITRHRAVSPAPYSHDSIRLDAFSLRRCLTPQQIHSRQPAVRQQSVPLASAQNDFHPRHSMPLSQGQHALQTQHAQQQQAGLFGPPLHHCFNQMSLGPNSSSIPASQHDNEIIGNHVVPKRLFSSGPAVISQHTSSQHELADGYNGTASGPNSVSTSPHQVQQRCTAPVVNNLQLGPPAPGTSYAVAASQDDSNIPHVPSVMHNKKATAAAPNVHPLTGDLVESPASKSRCKNLCRQFRKVERESGPTDAFNYAMEVFTHLPERNHWRICLELADLCKRHNQFSSARQWFARVNQMEPYAAQGWLEHAKMEEESGELVRCRSILQMGIQFCPLHESLLIRCIKIHERLGDLSGARAVLASLKHAGVERVWRTILEGALLEARAGNVKTARRIFKYLMQHVSWYGPVYLEACKFEAIRGHLLEAVHIAQTGLKSVSKYGPLWFKYIRLCEHFHAQKIPKNSPLSADNATEVDQSERQQSITTVNRVANADAKANAKDTECHDDEPSYASRFVLDTTGNIQTPSSTHSSSSSDVKVPLPRTAIAEAQKHISRELLWKSYFELAQLEEKQMNFQACRRAYADCVEHCPQNLLWKVWLAGARMELHAQQLETARKLLQRAKSDVPKKMRAYVYLEESRFFEFQGDTDAARQTLENARKNTSHEWKLYLESVLLEIRCHNITAAIKTCEQALQSHPGTGRLWAMLIQLQQYATQDSSAEPAVDEQTFRAQMHEKQMETFAAAVQHVPKSGEVWNEGARLFMNPTSRFFNLRCAKRHVDFAIRFTPQYGDSFIEYMRLQLLLHGLSKHSDISTKVLHHLVHADPNYGGLWLHVKSKTSGEMTAVVHQAFSMLSKELQKHHRLYQHALVMQQQDDSPKNIRAPNPDMCQSWHRSNAISLHALYPALQQLCHEERYSVMFGSDPVSA
jgi:tetratricopeptide (TPR) repeat protein